MCELCTNIHTQFVETLIRDGRKLRTISGNAASETETSKNRFVLSGCVARIESHAAAKSLWYWEG
jgi:hypothetical protein